MKLAIFFSLFVASVAAAAPDAPIALPIEYAAHRYFVTPTLANGTRRRCYTDSGGGGAFLFKDHDLGLPRTAHDEEGEKFESVPWPDFRAGASIPPSIDPPYMILIARDGFLPDEDCFLGQSWFGGRVWTLTIRRRSCGCGLRPTCRRTTRRTKRRSRSRRTRESATISSHASK